MARVLVVSHVKTTAALGSQHLQLLGRFADRVILAFDADTAGAKAAARLHHLEAQQKLTLAVATLPSGTDPATSVSPHPIGCANA